MKKIFFILFLIVSIPCLAQSQIKVTGVVYEKTNDGNTPLPGATIIITGSSRGVLADDNGKYSIDAKSTDRLEVSFIGFESQSIEINGRSQIDIVLISKAEELEAVTVVAFGKQKKESVIGSISTVNTKDLKVPSSNLTTALAGRMAGVIAYQRSGEPGLDNADFFIRGVTTFGYKVDPLILIDGMEVTTTDLARLQPDDIASFSIMKDATATALYGSKAANGVILITTNEGKEGTVSVNIRVENSWSAPTKTVELADPITYMRMGNESVLTRNPLGITQYSQEKIDNTIAGTNPIVFPAVDWHDMLIKDHTMNQRANLNVSGGGRVARYYIAGTFNKDNGVLKVDKRNNFNSNIDLKQYSLLTNVNVNIFPTTEVVVRLRGNFDDYSGPIDGGAGMYRKIMRSNPVLFPTYYPVDDDHKNVNHIMFGNHSEQTYINPYADMVKGYKEYSRSKMTAQFELKQNLSFITQGLSASAMFNTNRESYFDVTRNYDPFYYALSSYDKYMNTYTIDNVREGKEYLGYNEGDKIVLSEVYVQGSVNYSRNFRQKHDVGGMLVFIMKEQLQGNAGNLHLSLPYRNLGLSGRFTYAFDSRYFGEFNFGYNGSERFYKTEQWGFFPSAGLGWMLSNESFMKPLEKTIQKLKLRASYGLTGNDQIGSASDRFFYLSNVNMEDGGKGASFGYDRDIGITLPGISISRYDNRLITWEISRKLNTAIELNLLGDFELIAEYFTEQRSNILMSRASIPATMGLQSTTKSNVGEASSAGVDISIDYSKIINKHLWISGRGNFTYAKGKYTKYEEPEYDEWYLSKVGHPIRQEWGYIAERLFIDEEDVRSSPPQTFGEYMAGDLKYRDVNDDGIVNSLDRVPIGYPTVPEINYGFGISLGYKNFDASMFFQGSARSSFWIDTRATAPFIDDDGNNQIVSNNQLLKVYAEDYWSEDNRNIYALWPRLSSTLNENNSQRSTWFMQDGSFLRLKQAEIGYSLPESVCKKINANSIRFYFSATNLLYWSKFKLWDVEMAGNGLGYPIQRVLNVGLQVKF